MAQFYQEELPMLKKDIYPSTLRSSSYPGEKFPEKSPSVTRCISAATGKRGACD